MHCVLIVDDEATVRASLAMKIQRRGRRPVLATGLGACRAIDRADLDATVCAFVDYCLLDGTGVDVIEWLRSTGSGCFVILMTGVAPKEAGLAARNLGVDHYMLKPLDPIAFDLAVERGCVVGSRRKTWATGSPDTTMRSLDLVVWAAEVMTAFYSLTPREARILATAVLGGASTRGAADQLGVSVSTVATHLASIYRKLGIKRRSQLLIALQRALDSRGEDEARFLPARRRFI